MADAPEPSFDELLWTIAVARLIFRDTLSVQAPPNLQEPGYGRLIEAGIDDWGGVSPVTPDHVNPERAVAAARRAAPPRALRYGKVLTERLAVYPRYIARQGLDRSGAAAARAAMSSASGLRRDNDWRPGLVMAMPADDMATLATPSRAAERQPGADRRSRGARRGSLGEGDIVRLFEARGRDFAAVDAGRRRAAAEVVGDTVSYAVVRNINYTNICYFRCGFCAFSKGKLARQPARLALRPRPRRRSCGAPREAWDARRHRSLHAGRHPSRLHRPALPRCLPRGARARSRACTSMPSRRSRSGTAPPRSASRSPTISTQLRDAGLGSLPGTAAEMLDDEVRDDPLPRQGLDRAVARRSWRRARRRPAHTATIMFGHVDRPVHWARHLLRIRDLQERTGGFTEFVPLPFVPHGGADLSQGPRAPGPTFREAVLMHAMARLALHPLHPEHPDLLGEDGHRGRRGLPAAGANDLGGTLMNESITRAAGAEHGQELPPDAMER